MAEYANPDVLVSTEWVQENIGKDGIKTVSYTHLTLPTKRIV